MFRSCLINKASPIYLMVLTNHLRPEVQHPLKAVKTILAQEATTTLVSDLDVMHIPALKKVTYKNYSRLAPRFHRKKN
jgi:hypothetical protein